MHEEANHTLLIFLSLVFCYKAKETWLADYGKQNKS